MKIFRAEYIMNGEMDLILQLNYTDKPFNVSIKDEATILIGNNPLKTANAIVWKN